MYMCKKKIKHTHVEIIIVNHWAVTEVIFSFFYFAYLYFLILKQTYYCVINVFDIRYDNNVIFWCNFKRFYFVETAKVIPQVEDSCTNTCRKCSIWLDTPEAILSPRRHTQPDHCKKTLLAEDSHPKCTISGPTVPSLARTISLPINFAEEQ